MLIFIIYIYIYIYIYKNKYSMAAILDFTVASEVTLMEMCPVHASEIYV